MQEKEKTRFFYLKQVSIGQFCSELLWRIFKAVSLGALFSGAMWLVHFASRVLGIESSPQNPSVFDSWLRSVPWGVWLVMVFAYLVWRIRGQLIHEQLPNFTNSERVALVCLCSAVVIAFYELPWWLVYGIWAAAWELVVAYVNLAELGEKIYRERF